jgi:NDP-sugar pyrophosphorylase family protein
MNPEANSTTLSEWPVAILAGGLATRLRPMTEKIPKSLVPVAGEPFLAHQLRQLHAQGLRRVVLCAAHLGEMIQAEFGDGRAFGMRIDYSLDGPGLLGTGGALRRALPLLGRDFFVLYGDSYLSIRYEEVRDTFLQSGKLGLMTVFKNEGRWDTSNVLFRDGAIAANDKKSPSREMQHIDYGLGVLRSEVLTRWPEGEAFDLADIYRFLIAERQLAGYEAKRRFFEIGSPEGLSELDSFLRKDPATRDDELLSTTSR